VQDKINILLVDDQPSKLTSYEVILADLGENLIKASSSREAFDKLLKTEIAVILMDVQMPELDGFELAAIIRNHPRFERTAIIFVSAIHLTDIDQLRGYAAGAVDYVSVPIVPEVLRAKVRVFAELYRKTSQLERMKDELELRVAERTAELEASTQRLSESERRRSMALATGSMGSWDWNSATNEFAWDEGQFRICGVRPDSFKPTAATAAAILHPDDRLVVRDAVLSSLQTGEKFQKEFRIVRPDGEVRWCVATAIASKGASEEQIVSGVTYDITERKRAEQALAEMNEILEQRVEERTREREAAMAQLFEAQKTDTIGHLTGGVAHDFNNLLMAILGSLDLLKKRLQGEKELRLLNNAIEGAQRGAALTKRLLAFARRQELKPVPVDVADLVDNISELVQRAIGPSVNLQIDIPANLPPTEVDPNQFELALLNLAVNARDAMPNGGSFLISAKVVSNQDLEELKSENYICISLIDTGLGMDEFTLARATEPFFTTKGPGKGTGLGLSMVYGMVAQSGGALRLSSVENSGTRVDLFLPIATISKALLKAAKHTPVQTVEISKVRLKTLLVDDDFLVRTGTTAMLEDLGHSVVEADSASEALKILSDTNSVDLLLTDFAMPGMNGAELIQIVRKGHPEIGAILMSGFAEANGNEMALSRIRLAKPFTQDQLSQAISHALVSVKRDLAVP
jgi:signal transduction histidine kinase/DNA-binding response OmpR family regulator